ncbi:MAG: Smr/MutS family protein [Proteobacteria bacterium]|nr:Smr/MutS family protein [Pseudomonadota bacterium]
MKCQICGNERPATSFSCPYCGDVTEVLVDRKPKIFVHKTVNLEAGRPVVEVALSRCREVIDDAILNKISVITLIHGYGSSGKGGAIKSECRKTLDYMKSKRIISDYIAGEDFHKKSGRVRSLLQRYSQLAKDRNLNQGNQGITLVILSFCVLYCKVLIVVMTIFNTTCLS